MSRGKSAIQISIATAIVAAGGLVVARSWCDDNSESRGIHSPLFAPIRVVIRQQSEKYSDIGDMLWGGRKEVPFVVANTGSTDITIGSIRVSCECLKLEFESMTVAAGTEVRGHAVIDMTKPPAFAGGLMLDAKASVDEGGYAVFILRLTVQVR